MKNRNGFVANSSSSSFILAFPCKAHTLPIRSMRELLFRGQESVFIDGSVCSTEDVAKYILSVLGRAERPTKSEMVDELGSGYVYGMPKVKFPNARNRWEWEHYQETVEKVATLYLEAFLLTVPGAYFYLVGFEDGAGPWERFMESGEPFRNIEHIKISHH